MSAVKNLYTAIIAKLDTIAEVKTTGKWNNQILNAEREIQFNYPAVFVDINVEWDPSDQRPQYYNDNRTYQQKGLATVTFHILDKKLDYTSDTFGAMQDIAKKVWDNILFLTGEDFNPMQRVSSIDDTDHDIVRDWQEVYQAMITEQPNADNVADAAPVSVTLDIEFDPDPFVK